MSDSKPVAASLAEIKAAFPKAKAEFIVRCLEKQLPVASVLTEALAAMDEELSATKAQLAEALAAGNAKAMETPEEEPVEAMEDEEEVVEAKAKAIAKTGVKPVAKANLAGKPNARLQWDSAIAKNLNAGMPRAKAVTAVIRANPGLRESMLEEVNASR
jgi:hypothetical protein